MLIQSPPSWKPRPIRTGNADWDRVSESLLASVAAAVPHGVGQGAEKVLDDAFDAWPVATGRSRDALELTYETTETTYTAQLNNTVVYAEKIHDGETVVDLILTPAEVAVPLIEAEIARLIGRV